MFFNHIPSVNLNRYPAEIQTAFTYLKEIDFDSLPIGRYEIKGVLIYAPNPNILFYSDISDESEKAGNFAVFFAEDIHCPLSINITYSKLKKIVVKITMSELE
ncbi:YhcH/YjgK/YiaL family protein [Otariodibacter sp.]|uniref:YhcH/YjgK/YiaL family protein n=1 Tax=Otariodibacter sp. TaxID=3030919 RepID=UPI00261CA34A|nr:YhcH/YjgK/YiaL family protein [Otariodibacter sp.]